MINKAERDVFLELSCFFDDIADFGNLISGSSAFSKSSLDYHDIEWFALEMNRDHSVIFEIASKYCISDSFVDHDGYSISSKEFLPTIVDIMVI